MTDVQVSLLAAMISLVSVVAVAVFATANYRRERVNQRINFLGTQQKYFEDIKKWADEVSDVLSEAIHLCELEPKRSVGESFFDRRHRIKIRLSSLIDRGRWFFPNVHSDESDDRAGARFRGYRQRVLNSLVDAYGHLIAIDYVDKTPNTAVKQALVRAKMEFVDEIQLLLDPKRRQGEFDALMLRVRADREEKR